MEVWEETEREWLRQELMRQQGQIESLKQDNLVLTARIESLKMDLEKYKMIQDVNRPEPGSSASAP